MRKFFRQLSLPKKLILIGVVPLAFLAYIGFQFYREKSEKVQLLELYTQRIYQSENLSELIDALLNERKLSFDLTIKQELGEGLQEQRRETDSLIRLLHRNSDISLLQFEQYTFVNGLDSARKRVDRGVATPGEIMNTFTNMIFRLNTLNSSFPATQIYLRPVSHELAAQRLITEMLTYLGILRSNIFNVLHTRQYMVETLIGTQGVHQIYHSYEREFQLKAPPSIYRMYSDMRRAGELKPTVEYLDTLFVTFTFNDRYTAAEWWAVSDKGINDLRQLQQQIWEITKSKVNGVLKQEIRERDEALVFLLLAFVAVALLVGFTLVVIGNTLKELNLAAGKIAAGDPDVKIAVQADDAIGSLADSIREMERQVRERTVALQQSNTELETSNRELEQFAYVASHDLQEPVRKIRTFADQLKVKNYEQLDESGRKYLDKILSSADRMKMIINDILQFSQLHRDPEEMKKVDLNTVLANVQSDLELLISQKNAEISIRKLPVIQSIPFQMNQLFYNLMNNALKFSRPGVAPVINITVSEAPANLVKAKLSTPPAASRYYRITFADNGIGFEQEYAEKIFVMFQRLTSERTGTGIGLALCRKIVENHKGHIEAHSKPGEGTRFDILLPEKQ
ncbi:MAG TPA: ATP-binding protein [Chitinophagaceae bacterium]